MIENTLSKIIEKKKFRINELKKSVSLVSLKNETKRKTVKAKRPEKTKRKIAKEICFMVICF